MSIKLMSLVFDAEGLTPTHKLVMLALCDYAADDGTSIYPSVETMHRKTALKVPTVKKALRELRDPVGLNLLTVAAKNTNRFPNRYAVNVNKLKSISWGLPDNPQKPRGLPDNPPGVTKYTPRGLPDNPDPSIDPAIDPPVKEGISIPDFDRACAFLKENNPADYAEAAPVLLESDEKPYRLRVKVASLPAGWIDTFGQALREVNPRRNYRISFETPGTGRPAHEKPAKEDLAAELVTAPDVTDEQMQVWECILSELESDARPNTYRSYIAGARPVSVNGSWTIEVPAAEWWRGNMTQTVKRIYKKLTGEVTDFVFVERAA